MENYLKENFSGVKAKNSSEEALRRWRDVCGIVKNPKRRFRFTANLEKRGEAAAMRRTNQVSIFAFLLFYSFIQHIIIIFIFFRYKKMSIITFGWKTFSHRSLLASIKNSL